MTDEAFAERITAAIADVAHEYDLSAEQQNILHRFGRFATKYRLTENIFDSAFGKAPVFRTNYKDKAYLSEHFFDAKFNDIENSLYSAIQLQMTPASAENLMLDFPEYNFTIDLTKSEKFVMENVYEEYVGGIDDNGHERKDNFRELHESLTLGVDEYGRLYTEKYDEANDYFPYEVYTYDNSRMDDLRFNITEFIDNASNGFTAYSVVNGEKHFEPVLRKEKVNMDYSELAVNTVNDFCRNENGREADLSNMKKIDIVNDVITDRNIPVSVSVDLEDPAIMYYVDDRLFRRDNFDSIELFYNNVLTTLENGRQNLFDIGVPENDFIEFYDKNAAHGEWQFYIIPDLKSLSANNGSVTPIERYDSLDKAIARFNELRPMEYNNDTEVVRGFPSAHLTMGLSNGSAELDILQVRGNQNYLVTDYTRYPKYADNENILAIVNDINEYIGFDRVMDFPKQNNGDPNEVIDVAYSEWQQPVAENVPDEQPLDKAKRLINQYSQAEFDNDVDFDDLHNIGLAYTTLTDEELSIQVTADLVDLRITYEFDSEVFKVDEFDSLEQMNEALADLDFNDLIDVPFDVIDRHTEFKYEIYQLKSGEENHYLRFESYDDLRKHGYEVDFNNYEKVYEGDLTEDTTLESLYTKFNLDHPSDFRGHSLAVSDIIVLHRHGDFSANYVDDVGYKLVPEFFRTMHEPKVDTNINSEVTEETTGETKPAQPRYSQNAYVDGVNTYELLIDEVRRGTGFENGKQRVLDYYNNNQPTAKELAAFLKKEYGIGGHSGSGNVLMVGSDSKGLTFDLRSGAKYTHSWLNVAYAVETQILEKSYDKSQHMPNEITVGDRYRLHSFFGDYEVTVTGLQGIYPDEVVVTDVQNSDRMGYSVTYNMARTSLYNDGIYLGNTENAPEKVDTNINSSVKAPPLLSKISVS